MTPDTGPPAPAFRPRRRLIVAATLGVLLVVALVLWAAAGRRHLDPPLMITPALGAEATPTTPAPAPSATPSSPAPSSARPTAKSKRTKTASPSPSPSATSRRPSPSPNATPAAALAARYVSGEEQRGTFGAGVVVANEGRTARTWEVRVTYDPADGVRVDRAFGARVSTSGNTVIFTGGPLAAGDDTMFGFRASTSADGRISPTSCRVDGRACTISFR